MPKEYIEREAFLADLTKRYCEPCEAEGKDHDHVRCRACWVDDMMGEIGDAPFAADVVEVVRCEDCKSRHDSCFAGVGNTYCDVHHKYFPLDGFCSYGERRDNDAAD